MASGGVERERRLPQTLRSQVDADCSVGIRTSSHHGRLKKGNGLSQRSVRDG